MKLTFKEYKLLNAMSECNLNPTHRDKQGYSNFSAFRKTYESSKQIFLILTYIKKVEFDKVDYFIEHKLVSVAYFPQENDFSNDASVRSFNNPIKKGKYDHYKITVKGMHQLGLNKQHNVKTIINSLMSIISKI